MKLHLEKCFFETKSKSTCRPSTKHKKLEIIVKNNTINRI